LDFVSFTTAAPTAGVCSDTFQVGGTSTVVPTICGANSGQHSKNNNKTHKFINCVAYLLKICAVEMKYFTIIVDNFKNVSLSNNAYLSFSVH
jgi:hypothetical protein